ncbi:serine/threonine-protein kinase [Kitasatospora sp. NPDC059577]|uniref:serine/threonine-protein kinase n=1 Tax=Kitasatospora sp. NPDC059577 TaxID=3346873 RepID=UPI0036AE70C8
MDDEAVREAGDWQLPDYTHLRELGAGAYGRVVLARHDPTGTHVAIKYLLDTAAGPALRTEAQTLARLDSPYVTRLYEYVEGGPHAALVMELVDGVSLRTLLKQEAATSPEAALVVLKGSLLGLAAAHAAGLVHRDYKPANVLVATDGTSKLVDFGIAVPRGSGRDISGTPAYLAPEQWDGAPASPAADVYAATVTFFECLTGERPFTGRTIGALAVQHRESRIPDELVPGHVRPLVLAGLAKRPQDRPAGAAEFVRLLDRAATAGYGEQWEQRGHEDLAALVALLALLLPRGPGGPSPAGTTALAHTQLAGAVVAPAVPAPPTAPAAPADPGVLGTVRRPLPRRRARLTAGVVAGGLALAVIGGVALAGVTDRGERTLTGSPMPRITTTLDPARATAPPPPDPTPSPTGRPSPSPALSPPISPTSPPSGPPTTDPAPGPTSTTDPGPGPGPVPSGRPAPTPSRTPTDRVTSVPPPPPPPPHTAPTSPPASRSTPPTTPPTSTPPTTPPPVRVASVNVDSIACDGGYGIQATVTVVTSGPPGATLVLSWMHNSAPQFPSETVATDTVKLGTGRTTLTVHHQFGTGDSRLQWGVRVSTTPAAGSTPTAYRELYSPSCHEPG